MLLVYEDFVVTIAGASSAYTIEVHGPGQTSIPPVLSPMPAGAELDELLARLRRRQSLERPTMERLGTLLYEALFPAPIARAFWRCRSALSAGTGLRLKLNVRPPELNDLPWELMYDPIDHAFVAAYVTDPIVRVVESGTPVASLLAPHPLRVLYVRANPAGTHSLDLDASEQAIRTGLRTTGEIVVMDGATPAQLRDVLRQAPGFHILHYDGHAEFRQAEVPPIATRLEAAPREILTTFAQDTASELAARSTEHGYLALHGADGSTYRLDGERLATYLHGSTLRLVVLAACETGVDSLQQRFSGIAHQLMRTSSLPAVVANQYAISDHSAIAFNAGFYGALADGYPVDAATVEGRKAILEQFAEDGSAFATPDWATPVLFMRTDDGTIFRERLVEEEHVMGTDELGHRAPAISGNNADDRQVTVNHGNYVKGAMTVAGDQVHGNKVRGDNITVGNVSNAQGIAIGRDARATVIGSSIGGATIDAGQLRTVLEELWQALGQAGLSPGQQITAQTAVGNALTGVQDDTVDGDNVVDNVKKAGEALQGANTVIEQGSSLWASVQKLAPLLGPLVGGARVVTAWFGIAL